MNILVLLIAGLICLGMIVWYFSFLLNEAVAFEKRCIVLGVTVITIIASIPCMAEFVYGGHDIEFHLDRIAAIGEELKNLQFPVRMQTTMMDGYGYATSLFYGNLFIYLPALMYAVGLPLHLCYNTYIIVGNLATAMVAYIVFKQMFSSYKIGIVGSAMYTLAVYRLINIFVRTAVGEYTAMVFFPLIILGIWNFMKAEEKVTIKEYFPLVIGATGIFESHILSCEMIVEFVALFVILNFKKFFTKEKVFALCKTVLWIVGLNIYFIVPFFMSYGMDLQVKNSEPGLLYEHGIYLSQMFNLFCDYSRNDSVSGTHQEMSLSVGMAFVVGLIAIFVITMNRQHWNLKKNTSFVMGSKCAIFSVIALFVASDYFPWKKTYLLGKSLNKVLSQVQFPWRYLGIATMMLLCTFLCVLKICEEKSWNKAYIALISTCLAMTIISASYFTMGCVENGNMININRISKIGTEQISGKEYLIVGTDPDLVKEGDLPYSEDANVTLTNYSVVRGVKSIECNNANSSEALVTMPIFNYDNYVAYDKTTKQKFKIENGKNNTIAVQIPANYNGVVAVKYQEPVLWRICEVISLITLICFGVFLKRKCYPKKQVNVEE